MSSVAPTDIEEARQRYSNGYYAEKLEQGLQFQDFCTQQLYHRGIVVVGYASRRYQNKEGENMLGAEIKRDDNFRKTGNVYLEVAEKAHPDRPSYTPSGIMREDNSWLFVIGDERCLWVFSTKYLRKLKDRYRKHVGATSIGHLMPVSEADKYCIRKIEIEA
jgi:hypothetical protein